jgi:hypothetical protein
MPLCFGQADDLFEEYLVKVKSGELTQLNSIEYMKKTEIKLFENMSAFFDELQVSSDDIEYVAPKDKVSDFASGWKKHSKDKKLKSVLKQIIQDPKIAIENPQIAKMLKENRKFSQFLRESFYIFDKTHLAPSMLEKVVKPFGKLNDAIVSGNPNLIEEYASKVLKNYKKLEMKKILKEFDYVSKSEFDKFFKDIRKKMVTLLDKPTHSVHDFHWIRKQHKKFSVTYIVMERATYHPKVSLLADYITELGHLNDIYVDMKMRLGVNLDDHLISLDSQFKKNIIQTIKYLETDMKSVKLGPSCYSFFKVL